MKFSMCVRVVAVAALLQFVFAASAPAAGMELVEALTSKLGVTADQAVGGAGAIFNLAKQKLSAENFAKVVEAIPDVSALIEKAPKGAAVEESIGMVSSMLGDQGGDLGGIASLGETFSNLGLDADMAGKFIPVILDYAKTKGGDTVMNLLKGVLPS